LTTDTFMPEWASYALVFLAGLIVGRMFGGRREAAPRAPQPPLRPLTPDVEEQVRELMRARRKIDAIKAYREATGAGLKDSKHFVEDLARRRP
jgi:hypothetical protein